LTLNNAQVAFGGYNEKRNIYQHSAVFKDEKTEEQEYAYWF
jgi:hypothetical protein